MPEPRLRRSYQRKQQIPQKKSSTVVSETNHKNSRGFWIKPRRGKIERNPASWIKPGKVQTFTTGSRSVHRIIWTVLGSILQHLSERQCAKYAPTLCLGPAHDYYDKCMRLSGTAQPTVVTMSNALIAARYTAHNIDTLPEWSHNRRFCIPNFHLFIAEQSWGNVMVRSFNAPSIAISFQPWGALDGSSRSKRRR